MRKDEESIKHYKWEESYEECLLINNNEKQTIDSIKIEPNFNTQDDIETKNDIDINTLLVKEKIEDVDNYISDNNMVDDIDSDDCLVKDYVLRTNKKRDHVHSKLKKDRDKKKKKKRKKSADHKDITEQVLDAVLENSVTTAEITSNGFKKGTEFKRVRPKFDTSYFDEYATVVLLTPETARQEVLLRKESSNYKNCQFKCDLCYRGFEGQATYKNHMKKHSSVSIYIFIFCDLA